MSRRALAWIFTLGLTARLLVLPYTLPHYDWGRAYPDTVQYEAMAANLRAGRGLVVGPGAVAVRPPLYPLVLAAFQAAFGEGQAFAGAVILAQTLLGALGCALAADLGGRLFGPAAGRIAGGVSALHPELLLYPSLLLTETLAVVLVTAGLWAAGRSLPSPSSSPSPWRWALLCGACCGGAALTRASLLPLTGMAALWLALALPSRRQALAAAVCCAGAACAVVGPWTIRNRLLLGAWVPVTTTMGRDLYVQLCPEATGGPGEGIVHWPEEALALDEVEEDRELRRRAWAYAAAHPRRVAAMTLVRLGRLWNPLPNDSEHRRPGLMAVALAANLPLFTLAIASLALVLPAHPKPWLLPALPALLLCAVHAIFTGSVRYRAPALPALGVMAGAALVRLRKAPDP
jgi:4-amino-4-deoxy-L-arabinose transferase-like glycosyltransferase